MTPPRLTLVHSASDENVTEPDARDGDGRDDTPAEPGRATARGGRGPERSAEATRDAAEALTHLARSALVAADVVSATSSAGGSGHDSTQQTAAVVRPSTADAAEDAAKNDGATASGNDAPLVVSDPEAVPPTAAQSIVTPERAEALRILEALLFAASEPLDERRLAEGLGKSRDGLAIGELLADLQRAYQPRGVNLVRVAGKWAFRTAEDLSWVLERHASEERRLSKAALETLSIIAYHQPVTRAEIEDIRGVSTSAGTLDILLESGWVRPRGRRRAPGRPVTYGTTESFLNHFGLDTIKDLPGLAELKGAGLLDATLPPGFTVPEPCDVAALMPDELPLDIPDDEPAQAEMELGEGESEPSPSEG